MDFKLNSVNLPGVSNYIESHLSERNRIFKEIEEIANKNNIPIAGPEVGQFLKFITEVTNSKKVLELGSSIGYSTMWFAKSIPMDGKIIYTDYSNKNKCMAQNFLAKENINTVDFYVGDALDYIKNSNEKYDIIFIDLDKELYPKCLELSLNKINPGGVIIADNTMWGGRVRFKNIEDPSTNAIKDYNDIVFNHKDLTSCLIPIKDGITISYKKLED